MINIKMKKMKMEELFEMYKNLDIKERIKFQVEYIKFNKEEEEKVKANRKDVIEDLMSIVDEEGKSYLSEYYFQKLNTNLL